MQIDLLLTYKIVRMLKINPHSLPDYTWMIELRFDHSRDNTMWTIYQRSFDSLDNEVQSSMPIYVNDL